MNENLSFFIENFDELLEEYCGKFIVIKNQTVIAAYDDYDDAHTETVKTEEKGTYIIQYCVPEAMIPDAWRKWNRVTFTKV